MRYRAVLAAATVVAMAVTVLWWPRGTDADTRDAVAHSVEMPPVAQPGAQRPAQHDRSEVRASPPASVEGQLLGGRVVDDRGHGITAATVTVEREQSFEQSVESDSDGTFSCSVSDTGNCELRASKEGYASSTLYTAVVGRPVTLVLRRCATIRGRLVDASGGIGGSHVVAVPVQAVHAEEPIDEVRVARTASDGRFELSRVAPGRVRLAAFGTQHLPLLGPELRLAAGGTFEPVVLTARRGALVHVRVQSGSGAPIAAARVTAEADYGDALESQLASIVDRLLPEGSTVVTDADGLASVRCLPAGERRLDAQKEKLSGWVAVRVPETGVVTATVVVRGAGSLRWEIVEAGRLGLDTFAVCALGPLVDGVARSAVTATSNEPSGHMDDLTAGDYELHFCSRGAFVRTGNGHRAFGTVSVPFRVEEGKTAVARLNPNRLAFVRGSVSIEGTPVSGVELSLQRIDRDAPSRGGRIMLGRPSAVTDHAGVFQLSPVAAGSYLLSVQTSDRRGDVVLPLRVREAERREPRIELTRHELALRVVGSRGSELAGARAMLVPAVEPAAKTLGFAGVSAPGVGISRARTAEAGDGGTVRFAGVLCGTYHVRVVADGYLPRSVTSRVPPASEGVVLVELEAGGAIEGDIVDVNGQRVLAPVDVSLGTGENKVETVSDRGRFRLDSVRPGSHVVEASLEPLLATRKPVRQIVHVQPGVTAQVRIVLPP